MRQLKISKSITPRSSQSLDTYLQEIGKVKLISANEENELAQRIKQGDQQALEKLTNANLRFVVSVAKQYQNQGLPLMDLINDGNLGLIKAAKRFDESRGFKFISYAVWRIRQSILQGIAEQGRTIRLPLNQIGAINKIDKTSNKLEQKLQRTPTAEEISEALEIGEDDVLSSSKISPRQVSLDAPIMHDDNETTFMDIIQNSDHLPTDHLSSHIESLQQDINRMISTILTMKEKTVIEYYFGLNGKQATSMDEIGNILDLTRERIRQIKEKAIKRLKRTTKSKLLKKYLE